MCNEKDQKSEMEKKRKCKQNAPQHMTFATKQKSSRHFGGKQCDAFVEI